MGCEALFAFWMAEGREKGLAASEELGALENGLDDHATDLTQAEDSLDVGEANVANGLARDTRVGMGDEPEKVDGVGRQSALQGQG